MEDKRTKILIMPGLGDSGENHWQSFWLKKFNNSVKLIQDDWDEPKLDHWVEKLNNTILKLDCPIILVAHSLAVSLILQWASRYNNSNVKGALLVAPADVDSPAHTPDAVRGFGLMPISRLPFPSIVVASDNDPFVSINRAKNFAEHWGSDFINVGSKGHINSESKLESWEDGQMILQRLVKIISL